MAKGLTFFAFGLCKKVLIADKFALIANQGFSHIGKTNTLTAMLAIFSYTAQIYFDFSGYSDMAIGIASMLNIDLPINFNSPYKATSIGEFWRRWHISLTGFLTKDLYIPLGGNRKGKWRTCLNIMIVFLVSGIWHGAGLTFLVWGAIHGFASILSKVFRKYLDKLPRWIDWMLTMGIVCGAWIFFRSPDLHQAWRLVKHVLACNFEGGLELMEEVLTIRFFRYIIRIPIPSIRFAVYGIFDFLIPLYLVFFCKNSQEWIASHKPTMGGALFISCLLAVSLLSFTKVTTFVYAFF